MTLPPSGRLATPIVTNLFVSVSRNPLRMVLAVSIVALLVVLTGVSSTLAQQGSDTNPPSHTTSTVDGATMALIFDESLDSNSIPDTGDFAIDVTDSVTKTQSTAAPSAIVVQGTTVTLTLDYEVRFADTVALVYTVGSQPIKDSSGNSSSNIGTVESPYSVTNQTAKKNVWDFTLVTFHSINSERTYEITKDEPREFTVENEDEYLDLDVLPVDPRTQLESIRWFRGSTIQYPDISQGDTRIRLPRQGTGTSNFNRAGIRLKTETEELTDWYDFKIFRKLDTTPPSLSGASIDSSTLTLTFSETLDQGSIPAETAFEVTVTSPGESDPSMPGVTEVDLDGSTVTLTLDTIVRRRDTVTLAYTKPQTDMLKDPVNLPVASFTGQAVTNTTAGATENSLGSLTLSGITLTPAFASSTTQYTADVGSGVDQTTVMATPTDAFSTVNVFPEDVDTNVDGHQVTLVTGPNAITITVTPEDATALSAMYVVTVTRQVPAPDTTAPVLVGSSSNGPLLTLTYNENLDEDSSPQSSSFIVAVNGSVRTVSAVAVNGTEVRLTLDQAVEYDDILTLAYTGPTEEDAKPIQDLAGLDAPAIPVSLIENVTPDPSPPVLGRVSAVGDVLTLPYDDDIDEESTPVADSFTVAVNGSPRTVSAVDVTCKTVKLNLSAPVQHGENLTLSYTPPTGENSKPIQNLAGLAAPAIPEGSVAIDGIDTTPPSLIGGSVLGDVLTLNFGEALDENSVPEYNAFTVTVNDDPRTFSGLSIKCNHVTLTLDTPTEHGHNLVLAYTVPTGVGSSPFQDLAGLHAPAITGFNPSNKTPDTTPPILSGKSANQAKLTLTYDEALHEDTTPPTTAFTVAVDGNSRTVSEVSIAQTDVVLTLSPPVQHGNTVTLAYAVPSGDDTAPIRNLAGLPAPVISRTTVTNDTPDTTPPSLVGASVAGDEITLTYNEILDTTSKPGATDFNVEVTDSVTDGVVTPTITVIGITDADITLTIDHQVRFGDTVTLVYTSGATPIQDTSENNAANIGSLASPHTVTNSSPKSQETGVESVTFSSVNSERSYVVTKASFGQALTVENEDHQLDVRVSLTDTRAQISSIQWRDGTDTYHSTNISEGDTRVALPRYGDGQSNYNKVKVEVQSEAGTDSHTYHFSITRKPDTIGPSLWSATVDGTSLTLSYSEELDESSVPDTTDAAVTVLDSVTTVSSPVEVYKVTVLSRSVILTLAKSVRFEDTVTLNYAKGNNPIEDSAQNPADNLSGQSVTNETAKATINTLNHLSLSNVTLTPTFSSATTNYMATVPNETDETTIIATTTDSRATVDVTSTDPDEKIFTGDQVTLKVGDTAIMVSVTPEDASRSQRAYMVTVTRRQDTTAPVLVGATVHGSAVNLTYNETLDPDSAPGNGAFSVTIDGSVITVSMVFVIGTSVSLTLDQTVEHGDAVSLTYTVPTGEDANPIQDIVGNPAPSIANETLENETPDTTPPELGGVSVEGETLLLAYRESLGNNSTPAPGSFTIVVNESTYNVADVSITGSQVALTVDPAVEHGDSVTLSYAPPTGPDAQPLQDIAGNPAAAIVGLEVDNNTPDTTPPELVSMSMVGADLIMTYDEPLDQDSRPQTSAFTITVNQSARTVSGVSIVGSAVTLRLDMAVEHGDIATLAYAVPSAENAKPLKDLSGNPALSITSRTVSNDTPDTTSPELSSISVSGFTMTLTYNEDLSTGSIPGASDFTIGVTDSVRDDHPSVRVTEVKIQGKVITLTLDPQVRFGDTVTLVYVQGPVPIQDIVENNAASIGSTDLPYAVANSTPISEETGVESVTFESIISDRTYLVPMTLFNQPLTVENTDDQLDITVGLTDIRARVGSIRWRDRANDYHSTNLSEGDTRITLPLHGDGSSNYNNVKIEVRSESGDATQSYNFNITRKSDTTAPRLVTATANDSTLTLEYDESLDPDSTPEVDAFNVSVEGEVRTASEVTIIGARVVMSLDPPVEHRDTVVLTYTVPTGSEAKPIRDLAGVIAPAIRSGLVKNLTPDTTPPELISASVNGVTLTLGFDEQLDLDSTPAHDDFSITVVDSVIGSQSVATVVGLVVSDTKVTLTLGYEVLYADTVTMAYVPGSNPIRDIEGNSAADIGTEQTPRQVDNPTEQSTMVGYAAVIFRSVDSDRAYELSGSDSKEFTVENEDEFLEVEIVHAYPRVRVESIEWFNSSKNQFQDDGNLVRLRLQGDGYSNRNRVRISLLSELGDGVIPYEFQITREVDIAPPVFAMATVTADILTLTYNEPLNPDPTPAGSDFSVIVVDPVANVFSMPDVIDVAVEANAVILELDRPVRFDDTVTLTYAKGVHPIRDVLGNPAGDLHHETVENETLPDANNTLIALSLRDVTLAPIFDPFYTDYSATVVNETNKTTIAAVATDPRADVRITPEDGDRNTEGHQVTLESVETSILITVTPEDPGAEARTYTVRVNRLPDTLAPALTVATVDGPALTLTYNEPLDENSTPAVDDFSATVVDSLTGRTSLPTLSNITIGDTLVALNLYPPVRYEDHVTLTYTLGHSPIRDQSTNYAGNFSHRSVDNDTSQSTINILDRLEIEGTAITLVEGIFEYTFAVDHPVEQATIVALPTDSRSAVSVSPVDADDTDENGHQVILEDGETAISITVTPEDAGALQGRYAITATRLPDTTDPNLVSAMVDGTALILSYDEALDQESKLATGDFTVDVVDSLTGGRSVASVFDVALSDSDVILTLVPEVRYQDRVNLAYTPGINPIRDKAGNNANEISNLSIANGTSRSVTNTLSALSLRGIILTPGFSPAVTFYAAIVAPDVGHLYVTARSTDPRATMTMSPGGSDIRSGRHQVTLSLGLSEITVTVIPEDITSAPGSYTITIRRAHPASTPMPLPANAPAPRPNIPASAASGPQSVLPQIYTPLPTLLLRPTPTATPTPRPTNTRIPTPIPASAEIPTRTPVKVPSPTLSPTGSSVPPLTLTATPIPTSKRSPSTQRADGTFLTSTPIWDVWGPTPTKIAVELPHQAVSQFDPTPTDVPLSGMEMVAREEHRSVRTPTPEPTPSPFDDKSSPDQPGSKSPLDDPVWLVILALSGLLAWRLHERFRRWANGRWMQ